MKTIRTRRYRRVQRSLKSNGSFFKKESQQDSFFGEVSAGNFFNPAILNKSLFSKLQSPVVTGEGTGFSRGEIPWHDSRTNSLSQTVNNTSQSVQRKCKECEEEEKNEKKVQRQAVKKEEEEKRVQRQPVKKEEEEKKVQRQTVDKEKEKEKGVIGRKAEPEKEEEKKVQMKENNSSSSSGKGTAGYINTLSSKGNHLPVNSNYFFSSRMGYNFSNVKVHTDKEASASAKEINARAYTIGNNIVFNEGEFNPESSEGKKLLAHELVHIIQQNENPQRISRQEDTETEEKKLPEEPVITSGEGPVKTESTRHYANCAGVNVQGHTDANYSHSFSHSGSSSPSKRCADCEPPDCVSNTGTIISVFSANPAITLPDVPSGLSECETNAVSNFINTTLLQHEQRHVAAFNTYAATIRTPYTYQGCASGLEAFLETKHNTIESARRTSADAKSAALDPFNPQIPCNCP